MVAKSPESVFTPGKIPVASMFEQRNERDAEGNPGLQDRVASALRGQGIHVLLHGDSGVGKSSLLDLSVGAVKLKMKDIGCYEGDNFNDLIDRALSTMMQVREISRSSNRESEGSIEGVAGASAFLNIKARISRKWGWGKSFEVLQVEPAAALVSAMRATGTHVLQFDNFHNVKSQVTRIAFAQMMERVSTLCDRDRPQTIAVVGISADAPSLLGGDIAHLRRTKQIPIPRMDDPKIAAILSTGFKLLEIEPSADVQAALVFAVDGFPYYAHNLGLLAATAYRDTPGISDEALLQRVFKLAAEEVDASFDSRFKLAVESARAEIAPRRRILQILCESPVREWTGQDVVANWEERFEVRSEYSFLWAALGKLVTDEAGAILSRTGTSGKYSYQFADPHLRPYLRMKFREMP
ncbi:hypothetical protein [Microbacterium sp. A84]|uniref:hypothetical protein n=1 Tax=Microbacterium sp. A84 TaxID=3450715 RepID=UPI003F433286